MVGWLDGCVVGRRGEVGELRNVFPFKAARSPRAAPAHRALSRAGIENIGVQIEQPMWVLPLRSFADGAARAVGALRAEHAATSAAADAAAPGDAPP
jgi:hypothetical protein